MVRRIKLDEHVGRVDATEWAKRDDFCTCVLFLTEAERYTLLSHLLPYASWPTRFVVPVDGDWYETASEALWTMFKGHVDNLTIKLTGGDAMGCNDAIGNGLMAIANALRAQGGGAGCASGTASVLNCLGGYTVDELADTPADGVDPGGETPPPGFSSMAEYLTYKCKVAHAIIDDAEHFFRTLQGLNGALASMDIITPIVVAALLGTGAIVFPPSAVVALAVVCLTTLTISTVGFQASSQIADYINANRETIICSLYQSSAPTEAVAAMSGLLEDAIQAVAWGELFGALGETLAAQFGALAANFIGNGTVNALFRLVVDFAYPEAQCNCESGTDIVRLDYGTLISGTLQDGDTAVIEAVVANLFGGHNRNYVQMTSIDGACVTYDVSLNQEGTDEYYQYAWTDCNGQQQTGPWVTTPNNEVSARSVSIAGNTDNPPSRWRINVTVNLA